jgi:hypothetical protein
VAWSPQPLTWTEDPDHGACSWMGLSDARMVAGSGAARDIREQLARAAGHMGDEQRGESAILFLDMVRPPLQVHAVV